MSKPHEARSALAAVAIALLVASPQAQKGWTLETHPGDVVMLSLRAAEAPLSEVAADLAKRLKLPITVDPALRQVPVTVRVEKRGLEEVLPLLAPRARVYVDYEVSGTHTPARPLAVFFHSDTAEAPPLPVDKTAAEVHVISGNTEDGEPPARPAAGAPKAKAPPEPPLVVKLENNLLTVRARQQPLIAILYEVAGKLGASVSVGTQTPSLQQLLTAPADVQLESADVETGLLSLSRTVHLYVRRALQSGEARVLRITLVESPG
jgi:hypothetical protein